ncbi:hypothetical protein DFQ26_001090 [Actinomortierella ambigua]|nr:hypothetical protein DFQ26_001090 [Actinomortierella ambigua]
MIRRLSVCAAFRPPVGRFKLSIKDMFLDVEDHHPGGLAVLKPGTTSTIWELGPDGSIMDVKSGLFLSYTEEEMMARLILTYKPVQWRTKILEKGLQITAPECELVVGMLPYLIHPPFVGLTKQDKEGSQAWTLQRVLELDPTPNAQDAAFQFLLDDKILGLLGPVSSGPVFLLRHPNPFTSWKLEGRGPETYFIQNYANDRYLSYDPRNLEEPLTISSEPSPFRILRIDRNFVQILADIPDTALALTKMASEDPDDPSMVGLVDVHKVPDQKWMIRRMLELEDSPRQHRLPFRRLGFW